MSPSAKEGYEKKDASVRVVFIAAGLLILLSVFAGVGARVVLHFLSSPPSLAMQPPPLPPEPRLESNPLQALQTLRAKEDGILNHYAWVEQTKGIVRIPIDRAMDLIAERGLPARQKVGGASQ